MLHGEKAKIKRNKKNIQLIIPRQIVKMLKKIFIFYEFEKILLRKALIIK
tara:strand:+ start:19 stop:168 length:150 start_codon:yes stop_codon:yes gene_type:complete